jgi:small-conductance mechanosensitive channel
MMHRIPRILAFLLFCLSAATAVAQDQDSAKLFDDGRKQIVDIRAKLLADDLDADKLIEFRDTAGKLAGQADALIADRTPKLETVDARLAELGEAPAKGAPPEAADITAQRNTLNKTRTALDAELKRAKLMVADGQQLAGEVAEARRDLFQAQLTQRTSSPLFPAFWNEVYTASDRDLARLRALRAAVADSLSASFAPENRLASWIGLGIGIILLGFGRWWSERIWLRVTADHMSQGRLRRSALAFAILVISTILPGLGAQVIYLGLNWNGVFIEPFATLMRVFVNVVYFGGLIVGLGRALLSAGRPSWRLPPISDEVATRLRPFPLLFAAVVVLGFMLTRMNSVIGTSLSATIAASFVVAVLYSLLIGAILLCLRSARKHATQNDKEPAPRSPWVGLLISLAGIGVIASLLCAVTGYVALGHFLARQMIWVGIVTGLFYLLTSLFEDLCGALLSSKAEWVQRAGSVSPRTLDQSAVLLSGAFRVVAFVCALASMLTQFGTGPSELVHQGMRFGAGFNIGRLQIAPGAVFGALAVLVIGIYLIRLLKRWLSERYLPTTQLDPGIRNSITTLLGYVGAILVVSFTLSALGLSLERIAWVASALSVGIGFGLQAIVQNFISGLILLVERPVKVGDWIALGDLEGDIRRINVRATEIQMGDRSTVIVPNSELITKTVRNITLSNAEGRVRIRLPLPIDSDAQRVRKIVRNALDAQSAILTTPAPSVLLDSIDGSTLVFFVTAFIASPRNAGGIRSELLIDILARLRAEGIALSSPQQIDFVGAAAVGRTPSGEGVGSLPAS